MALTAAGMSDRHLSVLGWRHRRKSAFPSSNKLWRVAARELPSGERGPRYSYHSSRQDRSCEAHPGVRTLTRRAPVIRLQKRIPRQVPGRSSVQLRDALAKANDGAPKSYLFLCNGGSFHCDLGSKAFKVAIDRDDGSHAPIALETEEAVFAHDVAVYNDVIPFLGMTHIIDRNIVMLAPEEGDLVKGVAIAKHIKSRGLPLSLGDNPMLDAEVLA